MRSSPSRTCARAQLAANAALVSVSVRDGLAEKLPAEAASFDAAVTSIAPCSVADLPLALSELRRVLCPGSELRFFEHVRSNQLVKASFQLLLDRSGVWPLVAGGCHLRAGDNCCDRGRRILCRLFSWRRGRASVASHHPVGARHSPRMTGAGRGPV